MGGPLLPGFCLGHFSGLALSEVAEGRGARAGLAGRTLLSAAPAGGQGVYVFDVDLQAAARAAAEEAGGGGGATAGARTAREGWGEARGGVEERAAAARRADALLAGDPVADEAAAADAAVQHALAALKRPPRGT